ncbi:tail fiber protein, partial [Actinobacillus porcinus]|uniref:tail fiber protein n=1 Tax=Actinobacillus porcinus TaxID=51048 RepID=UPI002355FA38
DNITGLQTALNSKANSSHTHTMDNITGLQTALNSKANSSHTHTVEHINGLQEALDEAGAKGLPVGAVVSFPRDITNPQGFLKCDGGTFNQATYPDLYAALGNKNKLPDLGRSDVGLTAWFPVDAIPSGWIAFDDIATQVTRQSQSELYNLLVAKYGSLANVPKVGNRFIRNAGKELTVGQTQEDAIRNIQGELKSTYGTKEYALYTIGTGAFTPDGTEITRSFAGEGISRYKSSIKFDASLVVPTADENRPKTLVLKLCIKAKNSFDDVVFWVKAFGVVSNVGTMNAGRLGQAIQEVRSEKADRNHVHTAEQISDFNSTCNQLISTSITYQKIGDFEITRFPDGTMIQTYKVDASAHGNVKNFNRSFNWAVAFLNPPRVFSSTHSRNGAWSIIETIVMFDYSTSTKETCYWQAYEHSYETNNTTAGLIIEFLAIGRWK